MIFEVVDPGYTWWPWLLVLIPIGMFVAGFNPRIQEETAIGLLIAGMLITVFYVMVYAYGGVGIYDAAYQAEQVKGIESLGFTNVDLYGGRFTANWNGDYFQGVIEEIDTDRFEVLEIGASK